MALTMQDPSVLSVKNALAIRILADADLAVYLKPFMRGPSTVKAAADEFRLPLQAMHYRVEQMVEAGLLEVVGLEGRRGRAIKHYQSTAQHFQIEIDRIPSRLLQDLLNHTSWKRLLERGLVKAYQQGDYPSAAEDFIVVSLNEDDMLSWGSNLEVKGTKLEELEDHFPAVVNTWAGALRLDKTEAKALQRELFDLYNRYGGRGGSGKYVLHLGLAPHPDL